MFGNPSMNNLTSKSLGTPFDSSEDVICVSLAKAFFTFVLELVCPINFSFRKTFLLDDYQKKSILERFICDLPKRQQLAINLCFYEGLSNNEAAEIIGVKLKALQSLIMRAKTTLKVRVKKYL